MSNGCHSHGTSEQDRLAARLQSTMSRIGRKLLVLSGKGGVGKSTVAASLAHAMAASGLRVGLLDVDLHGPSIPRLTGLDGQRTAMTPDGIEPLAAAENLRVMSIAFLLQGSSQAVVWRGPMKYTAIQQLLAETDWGELDVLVIDAPPGTGDEPLAAAQLVGSDAAAVIVTTPQQLAIGDVRRCVTFCRDVGLPIAGIVENMASLACPHCGQTLDLFGRDGGRRLAEEVGVPLLGSIPLDPQVARGGDAGRCIGEADVCPPVREAMAGIVAALAVGAPQAAAEPTSPSTETSTMKVAIPVAGGKLCMHFGHCEQFALVDVDAQARRIVRTEMRTPPPHEPGVLPRWLHEQGATVIIAGGMGQRAQGLFADNGIEVVVGAQPADPDAVVAAYLAGTLEVGQNVCDH